jgi:hypothetical protein
MYDYLVTYNFNAEGYLTQGNGASKISRKKKIKKFSDLDEIQKLIAESIPGVSNLYIYNFILIGHNKYENLGGSNEKQ